MYNFSFEWYIENPKYLELIIAYYDNRALQLLQFKTVILQLNSVENSINYLCILADEHFEISHGDGDADGYCS